MSEQVPEGWYADPQDPTPGQERWWNGHSWTAHTRHQPTAPPPPPPPTGEPAAPYTPPVATAQKPTRLPDGTPLGELAPRLGAHVIDVLLVYVVGSMLLLVVDVFTVVADELDLTGTYFLLIGTPFKGIVLGLLWVGYQVVFLTRGGATPGKRWLGLRVRQLERDQPLDTKQASLRSLAGGAGLLFVLFPGSQFFALGLIAYDAYAMQRDPLNRPWHEQLTGSAVVTTRAR